MSLFTYQGFSTNCIIDGDYIMEVDYHNRIDYNATPDILYEFIKVETEKEILEFCNKYGFLRFEYETVPGKKTLFPKCEPPKIRIYTFNMIKNNLKKLIELWNSYNTYDADDYGEVAIMGDIKRAINGITSKKVITNISSTADTNSMTLKIQCLTLEAYLYFMFYETIIEGNVIKTCPACGRQFETGINSNKIMCNLPGCDGVKKRNVENVRNLRQRDKSIALMSNRIHTQLNERFMYSLPGEIYRKYEREANELIERWKGLQEQYRNGEIEYHYLKEITLKELTEFRNKVKKGGK